MIMGDDDNKCLWYVKETAIEKELNKKTKKKAARNLSGRARGHMSIVII